MSEEILSRSEIQARSIRGGGFTAVTQAIRLLVTLLSAAVLGRLLAPEDFGLVMMVTAVTGLLYLFRDLGLSTATIQDRQISYRQLDSMFWLTAVVSLGLATLVAASAPLLARFYSEPKLIPIALVYSVVMLIGGLSLQHESMLRRQLRLEVISVSRVAAFTLGQLIAIGFAATTGSYLSLCAVPLVEAMGVTGCLWFASSWRPRWQFRFPEILELMKFGTTLSISSAINYFARQADNLLIGRFLGSQSLGYYCTAYSLMMLPLQQVAHPLSSVAIPSLSRLQDQPSSYRRAFEAISERLLIVTVPACIILFLFADTLIIVVLGPKWEPSIEIFRWLAVAGILQPLSNTLGWLLITQRRQRDLLRWGVFASTVSILSFVVGLRWGAAGVAASYAISGVLIRTPALVWWACRVGPVGVRSVVTSAMLPTICGLLVGLGLFPLLWVELSHAAICVTVPPLALAIWLGVLSRSQRGRSILGDILGMARSVTHRTAKQSTVQRPSPQRDAA
ncbi:Teichuronic acid biosynthesis protein TuaB [Rubripirellula obstinata]|uniref:Teichuronic acid biosynthesis protein TuaB n=1 Tax=Rubripirellula obstinata TaxID=406547 RepID=A0A5B1CFU9_9BACT|nr:lipopolysaccharide biosynthesis protein [Rubripirellula obstinata]KAA1258795.1 Teichuronic acid biosynthesis protein TuaB [Rubripirellula obstinata]